MIDVLLLDATLMSNHDCARRTGAIFFAHGSHTMTSVVPSKNERTRFSADRELCVAETAAVVDEILAALEQ